MTRSSLYLGVALVVGGTAAAQETVVTVRVVAHDAKIIGSGVGGARVTMRNAATGAVLARGEQMGGTGSTGRIMETPRVRGSSTFDTPGAAAFVARVAIDTPTVVAIAAEGPLGYPHAMQRASTSLLLVPGQDITGDGIVLVLHGFIVELLDPASPPVGKSASVRVAVRMLCGCPHTPGGLWDADRLSVRARIVAAGQLVREQPLRYAGEPNLFAGTISLDGVPSGAKLEVLVSDPERANFGRSPAVVVR